MTSSATTTVQKESRKRSRSRSHSPSTKQTRKENGSSNSNPSPSSSSSPLTPACSSFLDRITLVSKNGRVNEKLFLDIFEKYQLVYIPATATVSDGNDNNDNNGATSESAGSNSDDIRSTVTDHIGWKDLHSIFDNLDQKDRDSWTIETFQPQTQSLKNDESTKDLDNKSESEIRNADGKHTSKSTEINVGIVEENLKTMEPGEFLPSNMCHDNAADDGNDNDNEAASCQRGYCSFIVQHDKEQLNYLLENLPISDLPLEQIKCSDTSSQAEGASTNTEKDKGTKKDDKNDDTDSKSSQIDAPTIFQYRYGPSVWVFFGRNSQGSDSLEGRPEHTDSVSHNATWHYQLSGLKYWHVRPTQDLLESMLEDQSNDDIMVRTWKKEQDDDEASESGSKTRLDIPCAEGDIIILNTRLWWHSTTLPGMQDPSVSYARDLYLNTNGKKAEGENGDCQMTNLDGLYASNDIEAGTVIFRESTMPDCVLHRTKDNPNCEMVKLEVTGEGAIVSCQDIKAGEFFCILESDSEDDEISDRDDVEFESDYEGDS
eukprot:CAMPEP_0194081056 /NCGR_PEP_ID=MMETSP0149-20130528/6947_1 /TAXON_ID=122233 /ORGANISM="Chaetoceros debilis, Strain MM31A-1" /LENGTH=543 /DNA_ID=CAMNT_0038762909 /DNA_START=91 /DNA_END=1722 /DNA_ORIENTATION=-